MPKLSKNSVAIITSHLTPLTLTVIGAPQMMLQQYLSTFPCLLLPSGNFQTPFLSFPWCYLPISSSVFLSSLLPLSPAELSLPCLRILRCGHIIWVSVSSPWLGGHYNVLRLHSGFCCESPRSSHGLCRKSSEVSYSISSEGLGSFFRVLLSKSSSHRHKGKFERLKSWTMWFCCRIMCPKFTDRMADSVTLSTLFAKTCLSENLRSLW